MMDMAGEYLDFFFTEMATTVLESLWLLPRALSCLQVIVVVILVLEAMFHPHIIRAAWRKSERTLQTTDGHDQLKT